MLRTADKDAASSAQDEDPAVLSALLEALADQAARTFEEPSLAINFQLLLWSELAAFDEVRAFRVLSEVEELPRI